AAAGTPAERKQLEANVRLAEAYLAEVRTLQPALPTIVFEQTMKLYRRDREIHLLHLGRAHTEGDVFVYLPKEKIVITGDATIDEVKQRVPTKLAPTYEKAFSKYGEYRPWRAGLLANIERTFAMVS